MIRLTIRLVALGLIAGLMVGAIAACGGGSEPEPTADIQATIDAAVSAATPTETPIPEPTDTPEPTAPPTPNIAATVAAALAAAQPTAAPPPPTAVPEPTSVPEPTAVPPTATPVPTNTPIPTPTPTPIPEQSGPPCIIAGKVTIGGATAGAGTIVFARSQTADIVIDAATDANGRYVLAITYFDLVFDLYVGGADSGQDTPTTARGCREIRNLSVN